MSKSEADNVKKISTAFLKKHGYFKGWRSGTMSWTNSGLWGENKSSVGVEVSTSDGASHLRITYTQTDRDTEKKKEFDYKIPLTTTACRYGGERYWFICPWYKDGKYCGKRVGTLYKDGDYFACRHCYELGYSSQKTNRRYKMLPLFNVITIEKKIEELQGQIKRPYYAGKPTRKERQLEKLYTQINANYVQLQQRKLL